MEILTVTTTGARVHLRTGQAAALSAFCTAAGSGDRIEAKVETIDERRHLAVFEGLEPATDYAFEMGGQQGGTAVVSGRFTTLSRPPGEFLFTFATVNDIHVGEEEYGLIILPGLEKFPLTPGFKLELDGDPFWRFTNETVVGEINALDPEFVIVKGDLTTDPTAENMAESKRMLDNLKPPYHLLRGNHDRQGDKPQDWFAKTFGVEQGVQTFEHKGVGFVLIDAIHPKSGYTRFTEPDLERLESELRRMKDVPVFVYLHNPPLKLIERSMVNRIGRFLSVLGTHPRIAGVFYAHTHANKRISRRIAGRNVPFVETAATMDFPGGYNLYDVYTGGYTQTCVRPHESRCLKWFEMTEKAYYGLVTDSQFGKIEDRNFSVSFSG